MKPMFLVVGLWTLISIGSAIAQGQSGPIGILNDVGFDQNLDAQVPLELEFRDSDGSPVRLSEFVHDKPVVLSLVYFQCPMLCTLIQEGLVEAMRAIDFDAGKDYEVLTVSFDPRDSPAAAATKRDVYLRDYGRGEEADWHFLTGDQNEIDALTSAVGFRYAWDEASGQWAHASGLVVLTPDGHISKYLYGIEFAPRDLKLALVDAASGQIGGPIDQLLLYCFHYDPANGRYGLVIMNVIRLLGFATVAALGLFVALALRRDRHRRGFTGTNPGRIEGR